MVGVRNASLAITQMANVSTVHYCSPMFTATSMQSVHDLYSTDFCVQSVCNITCTRVSTTIAIQSGAPQYFSSIGYLPTCSRPSATSANPMQSMLQCFNPSIRYHQWCPHHQLYLALISTPSSSPSVCVQINVSTLQSDITADARITNSKGT